MIEYRCVARMQVPVDGISLGLYVPPTDRQVSLSLVQNDLTIRQQLRVSSYTRDRVMSVMIHNI